MKPARCFKKWRSYISVFKKNKKHGRIFSLAWGNVYWLLKSPRFKIFGMENTVLFEPKSWSKYDIYWLLKSSSFELFGNGKYGLFWDKKLMERWFSLFTEKSLFWTFRWFEIRSFFKQKADVKIISAWSFGAFHDIPGPGKYGFSCSVKNNFSLVGLNEFNNTSLVFFSISSHVLTTMIVIVPFP